MGRSYLATALSKRRNSGKAKRKGRKQRPEGKRGGRPVKYGQQFTGVLAAIWLEYGRPCGKLLVPMVRSLIDCLQQARSGLRYNPRNPRTVAPGERRRGGHTA